MKNKISCLPYNVMITAAGLSPAGINTVLSLKNRVNKIVGVDVDKNNAAVYYVDRFYTVPFAKNSRYIDIILEICKKEKISIIFPLTTEELLVLLKNINKLNDFGIKIAGETNLDVVKICNDKWLTNQYLKKNNCNVPLAFSPKNINELIKYAKGMNYPKKDIVFKPRITHGSRGFRILSENYNKIFILLNKKPTDNIYLTLKEITNLFKGNKKFPKIILMEYLKGKDYSVYLFCNKGKILFNVVMQRTGLIPGMSTGGVVKNDTEIKLYLEKIAKIFNFNGIINIQLIKTFNNGPMLYEINTRISATTVITMALGINYPFLSVLQAFGYKNEINNMLANFKIKKEIKLFRIHKEIFNYNNIFFEIL